MIAALARSGVTHVIVAFCAMGSWAAFANWAYPMPAPLIAGFVQGTLSACITLFLKTVVEQLNKRFDGSMALLLPPMISLCLSCILLLTFHTLSGTPEILRTIVLPLSVATTYAAIYNYSLCRRREG